jgi:hypothetical protein
MTDDRPAPPRSWALAWLRDETFWRQVAGSTIAALLAATVIFLSARLSGFLSEVPWSTVWRTVATGSVLSATVGVLGLASSGFNAYRAYRRKRRQREQLESLRLKLAGV